MKIICVGRNYAEHAKELNNAIPTEPILFLKPDTALLPRRTPFYLPNFTSELHYEVELVLRINKVGKSIQEKFAGGYYNEIGVGIDFTARDLQQIAKEKGLPWEIAKAFDYSAPISEKFIKKTNFEDLNNINFSLNKNGIPVQQGNTRNLIFTFDYLISYISKFFTLKIGDLIFTGTPAGVGKVKVGDVLVAALEGQDLLKVSVK